MIVMYTEIIHISVLSVEVLLPYNWDYNLYIGLSL